MLKLIGKQIKYLSITICFGGANWLDNIKIIFLIIVCYTDHKPRYWTMEMDWLKILTKFPIDGYSTIQNPFHIKDFNQTLRSFRLTKFALIAALPPTTPTGVCPHFKQFLVNFFLILTVNQFAWLWNFSFLMKSSLLSSYQYFCDENLS